MFGVRGLDASKRDARTQQITNWAGSETDTAPSEYKPPTKVNFPLKIALFASCYSNDRDEFKRILDMGVDINVRNPDGLTCVHQCCINSDYEFLEFLIDKGADINVQDHEGWTPVHAAASVGSEELVRTLLLHKPDLSLLTCDMELAVDVAQNKSISELLTAAMQVQGVDADKAYRTEEQCMLREARHCLEQGHYDSTPDPRTGASLLHIATCKDYTSVLELLLKVPGIDVNCQDIDGWTPMHAAAHWKREQPARMLAEAGASFDAFTCSHQSIFEVADKEIAPLLRQLREQQRSRKPAVVPIPTPIQSTPTPTLPPSTPSPPATVVTAVTPMELDSPPKTIPELKIVTQPQKIDDVKHISSDSDITSTSSEDESSNSEQTDTSTSDGKTTTDPEEPPTRTPSVEIPVPVASAVAAGDVKPVTDPSPPSSISTSNAEPSKSIGIAYGEAPQPAAISSDMVKVPPKNFVEMDLKKTTEEKKEEDKTVQRPTRKTVQIIDPSTLFNGQTANLNDVKMVSREKKQPDLVLLSNGPSNVTPLLPTAEATPLIAQSGRDAELRPMGMTTRNSSRIMTVRRRPVETFSPAPSDHEQAASNRGRSTSPQADEEGLSKRRVSLVAPVKSGETETQRSLKARHVRSTRRSTQGVSPQEVEEAKKLLDKNLQRISNANATSTTTTNNNSTTTPSTSLIPDPSSSSSHPTDTVPSGSSSALTSRLYQVPSRFATTTTPPSSESALVREKTDAPSATSTTTTNSYSSTPSLHREALWSGSANTAPTTVSNGNGPLAQRIIDANPLMYRGHRSETLENDPDSTLCRPRNVTFGTTAPSTRPTSTSTAYTAPPGRDTADRPLDRRHRRNGPRSLTANLTGHADGRDRPIPPTTERLYSSDYPTASTTTTTSAAGGRSLFSSGIDESTKPVIPRPSTHMLQRVNSDYKTTPIVNPPNTTTIKDWRASITNNTPSYPERTNSSYTRRTPGLNNNTTPATNITTTTTVDPISRRELSSDRFDITSRPRYDSSSMEMTDYRLLYEQEKREKEMLAKKLAELVGDKYALSDKLSMMKKRNQLLSNPTSVTSDLTTNPEDLHARLMQFEDQVKEMNRLREENAKMKAENGSLIRVISQLSRSK